jgi:hypothetical protein
MKGAPVMATLTPKSIFRYALSSLRKLTIRETSPISGPLTFPEEVINTASREFAETLSSHTLAAFNGRFERGINLAKQGAVSKYFGPYQAHKKRLYQVKSSNQYRPPYSYMVDLDDQTCECPDHWKGHFCKHRVASHIIEIASWKTKAAEVAASDPVQAETDSKPEPKPKDEPSNGASKETDPLVQSGESIIWAVIKHNGDILGVEVLNIDDENVTVRALPAIKDGKKLQPQFPFEGGKSSLDIVPKESLFHVKVFQHP